MSSMGNDGDSKTSSADHTIVVLDFTPNILTDPRPLLPKIFDGAFTSKTSITVICSTPPRTSKHDRHDHGNGNRQLYTTLRQDGQGSWTIFQSFLGKVYAALVAGQWKAGKPLMDVEVHFDEEGLRSEDWAKRLRTNRGGIWRVLSVDEYRDMPISNIIDELLPDAQHHTIAPSEQPKGPGATVPPSSPTSPSQSKGYPVVALGGTFDHLHAAHKLLLHLALFLTTRKLIVGVMSDSLLASKSNAELVQPLSERIEGVKAFLTRVQSRDIGTRVGSTQQTREESSDATDQNSSAEAGVELDVLEIHDAYGPTRSDPDIQALVVSRETLSGGEAVNRVRREGGLSELEVYVIDVIAGEAQSDRDSSKVETTDLSGIMDEKALKELKMGSTAIRQWIREHGEGDSTGTQT